MRCGRTVVTTLIAIDRVLDGTMPELIARFAAARTRYRARLAELDDTALDRQLSYFGRYDVSGLDLLKTHTLHLAGHRFFRSAMCAGRTAELTERRRPISTPW